MNQYSQASERIIGAYRSELNKFVKELDITISYAIYYELITESAQSFSDGWTEAMAWMRSHPDCTISEGLEAKASELRNRYPYLKEKQ